MTVRLLRPADLRLIHLVASKRRGEPAPALDDAAVNQLMSELAATAATTPFARAAGVAGGVLGLATDWGGSRQMAVLALCCQLALDGYTLVAPQGVLAGMINGVAAGEGDTQSLARWLEDRALPVGVG